MPTIGVGRPETEFYLIPNGHGFWESTDPRVDRGNTIEVNRHWNGLALPIIRLIKYWNRLPGKPTLPSYYMETVVLNVLRSLIPKRQMQESVALVFRYLPSHLIRPCPDPKGLGKNLELSSDFDSRIKVAIAAGGAGRTAVEALRWENRGHHRPALLLWARIFGTRFPTS